MIPLPVISTENNVTVVEFSVTQPARTELEQKLKPYVTGQSEADPDAIAALLLTALGKPTIDELGNLSKQDVGNETVYVIHNLPELTDNQARNIYENIAFNDPAEVRFTEGNKKTYNYYIMLGLEKLLSLGRRENSTFEAYRRNNGESHIPGNLFHDHDCYVSALAGVVSDGATTKFLNYKTATADPDASKVTAMHRENRYTKTLSQYTPADKKNDRYFGINLKNESQHSEFLGRHTRNVTVNKHDLVLWKEKRGNGCLMHRAIASQPFNSAHNPEDIVRIINGYFLDPVLSL